MMALVKQVSQLKCNVERNPFDRISGWSALTKISTQEGVSQSGVVLFQQGKLIWIGQEHLPDDPRVFFHRWIISWWHSWCTCCSSGHLDATEVKSSKPCWQTCKSQVFSAISLQDSLNIFLTLNYVIWFCKKKYSNECQCHYT